MSLKDNRRKELIGIALLLLASAIWGAAFTAQSIGAEYVPAFTFLASRSWIGTAVLLPAALMLEKLKRRSEAGKRLSKTEEEHSKTAAAGTHPEAGTAGMHPETDVAGTYPEAGTAGMHPETDVAGTHRGISTEKAVDRSQIRKDRNTALLGGLACGFFLFAASAAQQIGIAYTTTAKSGFLTAMYVVIVPIIYAVFRKKGHWKIWTSMLLAVAGLYLLCMKESLSLGRGDLLTLLCALLFSFQIMCVSHFVGKVGAVRLTLIQFFFEAVFATVCAMLFEHPTREGMMSALLAILYAGVMSSGAGYTLQTAGQALVNPAVASIAMAMESVFSAFTGWIVLGQTLSVREILGCAVMLSAIILAELPTKSPGKTETV